MDQRVSFMKSFAAIIEHNDLLKNNYDVVFADVNYLTEFHINNKEGNELDLTAVLTPAEFIEFSGLANAWNT